MFSQKLSVNLISKAANKEGFNKTPFNSLFLTELLFLRGW
jgi:hypothetical protein